MTIIFQPLLNISRGVEMNLFLSFYFIKIRTERDLIVLLNLSLVSSIFMHENPLSLSVDDTCKDLAETLMPMQGLRNLALLLYNRRPAIINMTDSCNLFNCLIINN